MRSRYHNGIPLEEFKVVEVEELDKLNLPEPPPYVLPVATKTLPSN